jgi:hypothetical protein
MRSDRSFRAAARGSTVIGRLNRIALVATEILKGTGPRSVGYVNHSLHSGGHDGCRGREAPGMHLSRSAPGSPMSNSRGIHGYRQHCGYWESSNKTACPGPSAPVPDVLGNSVATAGSTGGLARMSASTDDLEPILAADVGRIKHPRYSTAAQNVS